MTSLLSAMVSKARRSGYKIDDTPRLAPERSAVGRGPHTGGHPGWYQDQGSQTIRGWSAMSTMLLQHQG